MIRNPYVAGYFYPASAAELRATIAKLVDRDAPKEEVVGLLVPHAGYQYSGPVTGATISRIKFKDTFVIIGPTHSGLGKPFSVMVEGVWKTPLGEVGIDAELARQIIAVSKYAEEDDQAHQQEHAVEVQLPFLQYFKPDIQIVPIILAGARADIYKEIGRGIARAIKELGATGAELVKYQTSGDATGDYAAVVGYAGVIFKKVAMHPLVALARKTVETYVREGRKPAPPRPLTPEMKAKAGVFVSIHKRGALRGCIGTFEPQERNVAAEIITNAVSSATRDPRFPPIATEELADLDYSVDVLTSPEPVDDASQLDPKKYGVIVEAGWRRGLLLPDLEGVDTVDYQIDICRQKGGIRPDEPVNLYRFEVRRYK